MGRSKFLPNENIDSVLVEKAKQDTKQFEALYKKYYTRVHRYVSLRMQGNPDAAEDVTQETFVRAFRRLVYFEVRGHSYLTYLLRIANNLLITYYRKKKPVALDEEKEFVYKQESLEEDIGQKFHIETLREVMKKLPVAEYWLLASRYYYQYPLRKTAHDLGKSENAVKAALFRARKHLKQKLRDHEKRLWS